MRCTASVTSAVDVPMLRRTKPALPGPKSLPRVSAMRPRSRNTPTGSGPRSSAVQPAGVRYGRHGVTTAAIHHHQLRGAIAKIAHHANNTQILAAMVDRDCFTVAPFSGHYEPLRECGEIVRKGDTIGLLHDFERLDLPPWPTQAGIDGVVIAQAWAAPVLQGQHILCTGRIGAFGA